MNSVSLVRGVEGGWQAKGKDDGERAQRADRCNRHVSVKVMKLKSQHAYDCKFKYTTTSTISRGD